MANGGWWCCCNVQECWVFEDVFYRDDSTSLGSNWNEVTGQWGIEDDELVEEYSATTGNSGAQVFCTQPVPVRSAGEMFIQIEVPIASVEDGDVYAIWPCCPDTSTEGDIEVTFTYDETEDEWTTTITGGPGGSSATYTTALTGTPTNVTLKVCADHGNGLVKAWVSPTVNEYAAWEEFDPGTGRYCAVGHSNTGHQNRFDNFLVAELRTPYEVCYNCFCVCDEFAMPPHLKATIVDATNRAACLNDESWDMDTVLGPQAVQWEGGLAIGDDELNYRLTCGNGAPASFTLDPLPPADCANVGQKSANAAKSKCEPLALYFGPYTLTFIMTCSLCYEQNEPDCTGMPPISVNCEGEFWIVITEAD